ncbi:protein RTF2 homolog [Copidosoma floridanum]|uniref:protein RTF2 homolog n=1 Tax=Copidosoma floridanum TaxID=29053 RepID=UPI0006C94464|nr:protein RTF2 homolog [Copidosoma floridanum]XP_014212511.1 protein RTF2 homolog [Copidosoma floridanum]XP_014212512.1 protein RTF2 homolog [Copidosoma floridanum]XP_014212514.1 protein RTF2 homolog [Copidosoma floridanum]XP_014212515.1 protein RTF2 homolog [Copidosoma floridanum]
MGCDGGTIPRRDELVRVKKKPEKRDKEAELAYRWKHCSIRQLPLQAPIVACGFGRLYSKESVLEGLLDRSVLPESAEHIKNLKDVKNLNLTANPAYEGDKIKNGGYIDDGKSSFICPVTGLEMNGKYKFCFLWNCGCVMSERALKEIKSFTCHKCQKPFTDTDIVILNAQEDDLKTMQENIVIRKAERKSKKRQNEVVSTDNGTEKDESSSKKIKKEKQDIPNKVIKKDVQDPAYKKAKDDYSVAQDPKASEVLKSIFTTHKSASEQTRAHWVTYNPFYN